jgi:cytochrome c553
MHAEENPMNNSLLKMLIAACALACAPANAADVAAGQAKADEVCADCHGDDGTGDDDSPDIVKLSGKEFVKAMEEYQNGVRTKSPKMARAAKKLSAAEVADLAAYYQTLK